MIQAKKEGRGDRVTFASPAAETSARHQERAGKNQRGKIRTRSHHFNSNLEFGKCRNNYYRSERRKRIATGGGGDKRKVKLTACCTEEKQGEGGGKGRMCLFDL